MFYLYFVMYNLMLLSNSISALMISYETNNVEHETLLFRTINSLFSAQDCSVWEAG